MASVLIKVGEEVNGPIGWSANSLSGNIRGAVTMVAISFGMVWRVKRISPWYKLDCTEMME
jgi:hypothetical protein